MDAAGWYRRGRPAAMSDALIELLQDHGLRAAMAQRAYLHGRGMLWSRVAVDYEHLFTRLRTAPRDCAVLNVPDGRGAECLSCSRCSRWIVRTSMS